MNELALVYTMGKVGSSTVMNAVRSIGWEVGRGYKENIKRIGPLSQYKKVISMVRDPVARNVSMFFELGGRSMDQFINEFPHLEFASWFEDWVKPIFKVDVVKQAFSKRKGYQIYDGFYLVIRTENLSNNLDYALGELFDVDPAKIDVDHRAETITTRQYADEYREFIEVLKLPENLIDEIYNSEFVNRFYYAQWIEAFRKRWS